MKTATKRPATETYAAIHAVDLAKVPVMSLDRSIDMKEQARLARELFKKLKIKGVSVTSPNYSMAQAVEVQVPADRVGFEGFEQFENMSYSDMPNDVPAKIANRQRYEAGEQLLKILLVAFPNHDNRSEPQSDYYDFCWSVN